MEGKKAIYLDEEQIKTLQSLIISCMEISIEAKAHLARLGYPPDLYSAPIGKTPNIIDSILEALQ